MDIFFGNCCGNAIARRMLVQGVPQRHRRRVVASAHAGRAHHAHAGAELARKLLQQALGTEKSAGETVADPHGQSRRRLLAIHDDIEMRIEGRDLEDLDEGELHLLGERRQMTGVKTVILVLQEMEKLDQQIALPRAVPE